MLVIATCPSYFQVEFGAKRHPRLLWLFDAYAICVALRISLTQLFDCLWISFASLDFLFWMHIVAVDALWVTVFPSFMFENGYATIARLVQVKDWMDGGKGR